MYRFSKSLTLLAVFALLVAACSSDSEDTTTTVAGAVEGTTTTAAVEGTTTTAAVEGATTTAAVTSEEPILFAASLPLTGDFAIPGSKHADGYKFCVDEINARGGILGRQVDLLIEDNRSDPEVTVTQVQRQIEVEGADALLGTFSSLLTFPASTVANQSEMMYPIPSGAALRIWERGFKNIFYFQQNAAELIGFSPVSMIEYYTETGVIDPAIETIAIVHADDFFANAIVTGLVGGEVTIPDSDVVIAVDGYLESAGIDVVYQEQWPVPFTDWLTLANSIKNSGAEMVAAATASPDEAISLINAFATVQYNPKLIWMSQGAQSEFEETLGDLANGVTIHSAWHPLADWEGVLAGEPYSNTDFIDGFTASFGRAPDEDEAIPFSLCQGVEQAILGVGSTDNVAMSEWMHARTPAEPVQTILGEWVWDERGLPIDRSMIMVQWQDNELKFVYPVGEFPGTVDLVYPKPEF
jgi:branched-chain amino acid transport system substrate-binding protein